MPTDGAVAAYAHVVAMSFCFLSVWIQSFTSVSSRTRVARAVCGAGMHEREYGIGCVIFSAFHFRGQAYTYIGALPLRHIRTYLLRTNGYVFEQLREGEY